MLSSSLFRVYYVSSVLVLFEFWFCVFFWFWFSVLVFVFVFVFVARGGCERRKRKVDRGDSGRSNGKRAWMILVLGLGSSE